MKARQIKKNAYCPHCGARLFHARMSYQKREGYKYECRECEEDFFSFEPVFGDGSGGLILKLLMSRTREN